MGGFYNSVHIRSDSADPVKDILQKLARNGKCRFYLAPPINGWVGVFAKWMPRRIQISTKIAKKLVLDIIELAVYDDDVFCYWYFRQGKLIDTFHSYPDYFDRRVSKKKAERLKGHPEVFSHLVQQSDGIVKIHEILSYACKHPAAEEMPEEIMTRMKKMESFSKEIQDFVRNPDKMIKFFDENPELIDEDVKSLVQIAKQQNITTPEDLRKLLFESGKPQDTAFKAVKLYTDMLLASEEFAELRFGLAMENEPHVSDYDQIPKLGCVFASDPMQQFADVLGIKNAVTSYEYLQQGDTDDVSHWDEFIEIS